MCLYNNNNNFVNQATVDWFDSTLESPLLAREWLSDLA